MVNIPFEDCLPFINTASLALQLASFQLSVRSFQAKPEPKPKPTY